MALPEGHHSLPVCGNDGPGVAHFRGQARNVGPKLGKTAHSTKTCLMHFLKNVMTILVSFLPVLIFNPTSGMKKCMVDTGVGQENKADRFKQSNGCDVGKAEASRLF